MNSYTRPVFYLVMATALLIGGTAGSQTRCRDLGVSIGVLSPGEHNAITDVSGVMVGHTTLIKGDSVRTGVTAILPYFGNLFQKKVPAAIFTGNGFGKLAGSTQVNELGNLETPIVLTNTMSVSAAMSAVIRYTIKLKGNEDIQSVNAVVGETNDGWLNDIRGQHVTEQDVLSAIQQAKTGRVDEGNVGAGTGTMCFGFKGGIGTSSRKLPSAIGAYTVGVLVQSNFGGVLQVDGVPVGEELGKYYLRDQLNNDPNGSCMIVIATDAPIDHRNLERLASRALLGLGKTGGIASNGSGDYVIAFSTDTTNRVSHTGAAGPITNRLLSNEDMSPLFLAVIEATEEAIINSMLAAKTMTGKKGRQAEALPVEKLREILKKYNRIK